MKFTTVVAGLLCLVGAQATSAQQPFGRLAQQEAERRRAITAPARVITAADLAPEPARLIVERVPVAVEPDVVSLGAPRVAVTPAVYQGGAAPRIPVQAVSGGEVSLELAVDSEGRVVAVKVLRDTPPFTKELVTATLTWQFKPAEDAELPTTGRAIDPATRRTVGSKVLVVGLFRPPALFPTTLGQPPVDIATPSDAVAVPLAFPAMPLYPPQALFDGVVLAEQRVRADGAVASTRVLRSAPGLDAPALDVLRGLRFRPARVHGLTAAAMVYTVSAFRQPIIR